ncbi:MAG: hypothetical protein GYA34_01055 [Chloroflexi bacterium]|nr:hypothetical protein [Chloroflexota bacterium]
MNIYLAFDGKEFVVKSQVKPDDIIFDRVPNNDEQILLLNDIADEWNTVKTLTSFLSEVYGKSIAVRRAASEFAALVSREYPKYSLEEIAWANAAYNLNQ